MISMEAEIPPTTTIKERIFKDKKQNEEQNTAPREYLKLVYHVDPIRSRFLFPIFTPFSTNYPRDRQPMTIFLFYSSHLCYHLELLLLLSKSSFPFSNLSFFSFSM